MSLIITEAAAKFLLARVTPEQLPLRLTKNKKGGCGDIAHKFDLGARKRPDDTLTEAFGLSVLCDFFENPEFEHASIELIRSGENALTPERVVVIPNGAHLCGCGQSATMPKG